MQLNIFKLNFFSNLQSENTERRAQTPSGAPR